ncbi:hypothetical protein EIP86_011003 [Pleurotus ostreatoroseus]|nr:hypothetical protein EIP86_011003 [Pleurotus ostreatoroseus]
MVYIKPETPEQKKEKAAILAKTNKFRNHWNAASKNKNSLWKKLLQALWSKNVSLRNRCAIACKLYEALNVEKKKLYDDMAMQQYEEEMADFNGRCSIIAGSKTPSYSSQFLVRENASVALNLLLNLISLYMTRRCCASLLFGAPPGKFDKEGLYTTLQIFSKYFAKVDPVSKELREKDGDREEGEEEKGKDEDSNDDDKDDSNDKDKDEDLDGNQSASSKSEEEAEADAPSSQKRRRKTQGHTTSSIRTRNSAKKVAATSPRTCSKRKEPAGRSKGKGPTNCNKDKESANCGSGNPSPPGPPPPSIDDLKLCKKLCKELLALDPVSHAKEMAMLTKSTPFKLECNNMLARNRAILALLELGVYARPQDVPQSSSSSARSAPLHALPSSPPMLLSSPPLSPSLDSGGEN